MFFLRKSLMKIVTVILFLMLLLPLDAEVFSISPFGRGKGAAGNLAEALGPESLWAEPVIVNGVGNKMQLGLVRMTLADCVRMLKQLFPGGKMHVSPGAVLFEILLDNGTLDRIYLVSTDREGVFPVIQFTMSFPGGLPENADRWPDGLPQPPGGAREMKTLSLPERKVLYGAFTTHLSPQATLAGIASSLSAEGWRDLGGGVFMRDKPLSISLVSASYDDSGLTRGFVLQRPVSK